MKLLIDILKTCVPSWFAHAGLAVLIGWLNVSWWHLPGDQFLGVYFYFGKEVFPVLDHFSWWALINPARSIIAKQKPSWKMPKLWSLTKDGGGWVYLDTIGDWVVPWIAVLIVL
jgi:hypothetical protein